MYIADAENNRIRKVDRDGKITTLAGTGEWGFNREKGPATKVMLDQISRHVDSRVGSFPSSRSSGPRVM